MDTPLVDKTNSNLMKFRAATDGSRTAIPQIAAENWVSIMSAKFRYWGKGTYARRTEESEHYPKDHIVRPIGLLSTKPVM